MATKKILVIDYDQSSLAALQGVFSQEGYKVITASDGQAGWDRYNKESPDLVLMEAMLPKVHGFELCQRITQERNSQATVFIMTGVYKDRVYRTEALRTYGASEYFEKPLKMAELLASVHAVLGKPEPAPEARPARAAKPEPAAAVAAAPVEPRKRERPKADDDIFSLPADLDRLSREIPKVDLPKVRKPAPARREAPAEAAFESLADELLKSVVVEPAAPKKTENRTNGGNGNGHDGADIDQFLKSALAGLEIDKEKVKVPKTAPLPPPPPPTPPPAPPVEAKPRPIPPPPPPAKPKPEPPPPPAVERPEPVAKNTLTPGDPGSDISPFFSPGKPKPEAPKETPRVPAPPPAVPAAAPKAAKPAERPKPEPIRREPAKPEPVRSEPAWHEAAKAEPVRVKTEIPESLPTASGDIFRHREIFDHIGEDKPKKGFPMLAGVGIAAAAVAVAAFLILRPKPAPKTSDSLRAQRTVVETPAPPPVVEQAPPPEVKQEPVQAKPKPQPKKAAPEEPVAEGILVPLTPSVGPLPTDGGTAGGAAGTEAGSQASGAVPPPAADAPPPAPKTEATAAEGSSTVTEAAVDPAPKAAAAPAGPAVKEGDLVDLASVTSPPSLVRQVNPVYPRLAQQLGVEGTITVNALIDEKGNVIDTGILKGIQDDKGLGKAAEAAVRKWRFEPARKDGVAVKVWKAFAINFKAGETGAGASE